MQKLIYVSEIKPTISFLDFEAGLPLVDATILCFGLHGNKL